jgi:D,D-heptose 1,7-bisphosphate phosphatase
MIFFLDRDGTINVDYNFVHRKEDWDFCDGAIEAIRKLNQAGYKVVVVTNQTGIIRGLFSLQQVIALHNWVQAELNRYGARIDAWYVSPWRENMHQGYNTALQYDRKPGPGMMERAMLRLSSETPSIEPFHADVFETIGVTANGKPQLALLPRHPKLDDLDSGPETVGNILHTTEIGTIRLPANLAERSETGRLIQSTYHESFHHCAMAGDRSTDLEAAIQLGMKPYVIRSVHFSSIESAWIQKNQIPVYDRLLDAVNAQLGDS